MRINDVLLNWYEIHKRDLPWRNTSDPYKIWVSEIILQQTRVKQGYDYFNRFIERFPDVKTLAKASLNEVLKLWEGLGYYSRARNMHMAAKQITEEYGGQFPGNFRDLKKLKGVGDYTAAAIASIAYNEPVALVDGNVFRVLSRLQGIFTPIHSTEGKKVFFQRATEHMDKSNPGLFNQALMEYGALHCTPQNPDCPSCIFIEQCYAYKNNCVKELPVKLNNRIIKTRYFYYFAVKHDHSIFIEQRKGKDIWQELFQFPLIENDRTVSKQKVMNEFIAKWQLTDYHSQLYSDELKHQLTHQLIRARLIIIEVKTEPKLLKEHFIRVNNNQMAQYTFPRLVNILIEKYLTKPL